MANIMIVYVAGDYGHECNEQDLSTNKVRFSAEISYLLAY